MPLSGQCGHNDWQQSKPVTGTDAARLFRSHRRVFRLSHTHAKYAHVHTLYTRTPNALRYCLSAIDRKTHVRRMLDTPIC